MRGTFYLREFETAAATLNIEPITRFVHSADDIENAMAALGKTPNSGLIVTPETFTTANRELFIALAARNWAPTIYGLRQFTVSGGLMSYGPDTVDTVRRATGYIDRILRGERPVELPVQTSTKFELVIKQDREGTRPRNSADAARPRRRGDRMSRRREFITLLGGRRRQRGRAACMRNNQ